MSKKDPYYRQCRYETPVENGKKVDTAWLPEKLAVVGKKIYFGKKKKSSEESRTLWTITAVYSIRKKESWLIKHQMDYKHQREMSDV